jgi:hypothetical protein
MGGTTVTLSWNAPASGCAVESYVVEAGTSSGATNLLTERTVSTSFSYTLSPGTYYVRVRAGNGYGLSAPSNEIHDTLVPPSPPPCSVPPGAPSGLAHSVTGTTVTLWWTAPGSGCTVNVYVIEVGSATGLADIGSGHTGSSATSAAVSNVASGTYYVRARARNAYGDSEPSKEILVSVGP